MGFFPDLIILICLCSKEKKFQIETKSLQSATAVVVLKLCSGVQRLVQRIGGSFAFPTLGPPYWITRQLIISQVNSLIDVSLDQTITWANAPCKICRSWSRSEVYRRLVASINTKNAFRLLLPLLLPVIKTGESLPGLFISNVRMKIVVTVAYLVDNFRTNVHLCSHKICNLFQKGPFKAYPLIFKINYVPCKFLNY